MTPIKLKIPLDLLCIIWNNRKPNQTLDERVTELIEQGLENQKANAQLDELIKEGKVIDPIGAPKPC